MTPQNRHNTLIVFNCLLTEQLLKQWRPNQIGDGTQKCQSTTRIQTANSIIFSYLFCQNWGYRLPQTCQIVLDLCQTNRKTVLVFLCFNFWNEAVPRLRHSDTSTQAYSVSRLRHIMYLDSGTSCISTQAYRVPRLRHIEIPRSETHDMSVSLSVLEHLVARRKALFYNVYDTVWP